MISTTAAFITKLQEDSRNFRAQLLSDDAPISGEIKKIKINKGACGASLTIGSVYSSYIEVTIDDCEEQLENKELQLQIGLVIDGSVEYINIGYYTVTKPETSVYSTTFTAVGRITSKLNELFDVPAVLTLRNIADAITAKTGVTIVFNGEVSDAELAKDITGLTCKEALSVIAGTFGGFATEDNSGNIVVSKYNTDSKVPVDGNRMTALPEFNDYDYELNGIKVVVSAEGQDEDGNTIEEVAFTEGTPRLTVNNEFMTADLFEKFVANTVGYTYRPGTVPLSLGDPRLQPWDCLEVTDIKGNIHIVPCLNIVHTFDGGLSTMITAPGESETESSSNVAGPIAQQMERLNSLLITAQEAIFKRLKTDELEAEVAKLGYASVQELSAINADITNLKAKDVEIEGTLTAAKAEITDLRAKAITTDNLSASVATLGYATVDQLDATTGRIDDLTAIAITTDNLYANIADFGFVTTNDLSANFATVDLANVRAGSITQAMIGEGVVGSMQIADGSITDAKIVELAANKITAGTLSVERLEIRGSANSLVYALNDITGALQAQSVDTLNGEILTPRTITADRIVAEAITADEIAANAITANKILAGAVTAEKIDAYAVTAGKIAAGAVTAEAIAAGSIKSEAIEAGAITADKINVTDLFSQNITAKGNFNLGEGGALVYDSENDLLSMRAENIYIGDTGGLSVKTESGKLALSMQAERIFIDAVDRVRIWAEEVDGRRAYVDVESSAPGGSSTYVKMSAEHDTNTFARITPQVNFAVNIAEIDFFVSLNGVYYRTGLTSTGWTGFKAADNATFAGGISVSGNITEGGTALINKYVALSTAQTITGVKTFNSSNVFNGEQKFSNASYCPTITDTASGVGCAFKASRGLFNEALIDKLIMTSSTGKIPFYKYTGTSGGAMTGLTEVASISNGGVITATGEIISTSANAFRAIQGNYGFFVRNDGSNVYFMLTDSGNSGGNWNSLRPLIINCDTGKLSSQTTYNNTNTSAANMYINSAGMLYRTTNTSSRTIKHDIESLTDEDIKAENLYDVDIVQFKYNEGVITDTQDVRYDKVLPGFIIEDLNEVYPIAVDKPSNDVKEWSWNERYLIPPMLKLIQDQHEVDISHAGRIARAEAQIENLQEQLSHAMITIAKQQKEIDSLRQAS